VNAEGASIPGNLCGRGPSGNLRIKSSAGACRHTLRQRSVGGSVGGKAGALAKETRTNNCFDFLPGNREQSRGERQQAIQLFLRVS
jgi:hypothetical protein